MTAARSIAALAALALVLAGVAPAGAYPRPGGTEAASAGKDSAPANGHSSQPSVSADGRFVAFQSVASNLVPGDTNGVSDVFVRALGTGAIERVSVSSDGTQADGASQQPSISADGRFVAFASAAPNLVPDDTGSTWDVFVHDRESGSTEQVSDGGGASVNPAISADGRFVTYQRDTGGQADVFVRDRQTGVVEQVAIAAVNPSISGDGRYVAYESGPPGEADVLVHDRQTGAVEHVAGASANPAISADGRHVAFERFTGDRVDVFFHDLQTGSTEPVSFASDGSPANGSSLGPSLSADGRFVAFTSWASNLVAGDGNGASDVFVHDLQSGSTERMSVASDGAEADHASTAASFSADGRVVAFASWASNLAPVDDNNRTDVFARHRDTGATEQASTSMDAAAADAGSAQGVVSADGRYVAFRSTASNLVPGDTNGWPDIFVRDRVTGVIERVSVATDGTESNHISSSPSISADGRNVAFSSTASNLVPDDTNNREDVFVHDRVTGTTERVSVASDGTEADGASQQPVISGDGRHVAFRSAATNLVEGDTNGVIDVFVHDRETGETERVSVASDGAEGNANSWLPSISGDGRHVAFQSGASNLVAGDTNESWDVFVHDRETGSTERVSVGTGGADANDDSFVPSLSADGRLVAFQSAASNLVPGDTNGVGDVFVHDRDTGVTERVSVSSAGGQANDASRQPAMSADGRYVAFTSRASNLVPGDSNNQEDVFVHDRSTRSTERVSVASDGEEARNASGLPAISGDGRHVAFQSWSSLVPNTDGQQVFVRDRGPAAGAGRVVGVAQGDQVSVSGWATFSGQVVATGDASDGVPGAHVAGAELIGASLTYRPEHEDLLVRLNLASLPPNPGGAAIVYGLAFHVDGTAYEVRGLRQGATPRFVLHQCDVVCLERARLSGGIGTTGPEAVVAVPLSALEASEGASLEQIRAFTAVGEAGPGGLVTLDEVDLPDAIVPVAQVRLGVAPAGTPEDQVAFDTEGMLREGSFWGDVQPGAPLTGADVVWARGCLGDVCGTVTVPLGGWLPPVPQPEHTFTEEGHIAGSNPSSPFVPGVTEHEFVLSDCEGPPQTQGVDGYVAEIPPEFGEGSATATVEGSGWPRPYDLDFVFYSADCEFVGQSITTDPDETAPVPAGTAFIVVNAFTGIDTDFTLTATMPASG